MGEVTNTGLPAGWGWLGVDQALVRCEFNQLGVYRNFRGSRSRSGASVDLPQTMAPSIIDCLASSADTVSGYLVLCGRTSRALRLGAFAVTGNLAVGMGVAKSGNPGKVLRSAESPCNSGDIGGINSGGSFNGLSCMAAPRR